MTSALVSKLRCIPDCVIPSLCVMDSSYSPLVRHMLTSWWPALQQCLFDPKRVPVNTSHIPFFEMIALPLTDAFGSLAFVIPVGFLTCHDIELAIFCLSAWLGMSGFARSGPVVSIVEVFPRYVCKIHVHEKQNVHVQDGFRNRVGIQLLASIVTIFFNIVGAMAP